MAQLHWEMLATRDGGELVPLAVLKPFARQLRTTYSPAPTRPRRPGETFRALVIGDPGDPAKGQDLPGARREAVKVYELLDAQSDVDVDARIGAPGTLREGQLQGIHRPSGSMCCPASCAGTTTSSTTRATATSIPRSRTASAGFSLPASSRLVISAA